MNHLPPRFKPELVYRFVPYLKKVAEGQSEVRFKASDVHLSIESAKARLRDAAIALSKELVFHPDINATALAASWSDYKVIDDQISGTVCIRLRRDKILSAHDEDGKVIRGVELRTEETNFEEDLIAFATLFGHYRLKGGIVIIGMLDPDLKTRLEKTHNSFFRQDKPNEHIMT